MTQMRKSWQINNEGNGGGIYFTDYGPAVRRMRSPDSVKSIPFTSLLFLLVIKGGQRTERGRNVSTGQAAMVVEVKRI